MIELRHLRYFVAVAEELHFGRAAQRLHIVQPALSRQIQRLEEEVGAILLQRSQRSVTLTAAGATYLEHARSILNQVMKASVEAVRIANGETGALKVAFIHSSTYRLLPTILEVFIRRHPQITLLLQEMTVIEQLAALLRSDTEISLLRPPIDDKSVEWETILRESFVLAVPDRHPLATQQEVSIASLRDESFILFAAHESPLLHSRIIASCEAAGFTPRVAQQAIQIHTVLGLVGAGLGIALVPDAVEHLHMPRVRLVPVVGPLEPVDVVLAWRRDARNPAIPLFRAAVKEAAQAMADMPSLPAR